MNLSTSADSDDKPDRPSQAFVAWLEVQPAGTVRVYPYFADVKLVALGTGVTAAAADGDGSTDGDARAGVDAVDDETAEVGDGAAVAPPPQAARTTTTTRHEARRTIGSIDSSRGLLTEVN